MLTLLDPSGSPERQPDSTHIVSFLHLPDSDNAFAYQKTVYFPDLVSATVFAEPKQNPFEMAMVFEIEGRTAFPAERPKIFDVREIQRRLTGG